ncbi:MAG: hypothetical protein Unbinned8261contig1001_7 [Prokaryotic dsDNA virus sp.]|nr:MAG: hypothetical protein Unbinned8261contig1001_7 [Prokaryotic dsDNA virus sp.]|tara:strand:+ start:16283 stop:16495 length:213 start_codon:yes stop_codon:yes gene_type:complete
MTDKKQLKNEQVKDNKMDSFLRKVSRTNKFKFKKGKSIQEHIKELKEETEYSKEEKEELAKQDFVTFEDL